MRRKFRLLIVVVAMVFLCTPVFAGGQADAEPAATASDGEPQYGGTFTMIHWRSPRLESWDPVFGMVFSQLTFASPFQEHLLIGDIEKYGPRGTNEYAFQTLEYLPTWYLKGQLVESWEVTVDPMGVIFHVRPRVYWTGNENIGMEPRELVAADIVFAINRQRESPVGSWVSYIEDVYAPDESTVVVEFNKPYAEWPFTLGYGIFTGQYPPEVVAAGIEDWRNQVGTGPFILTDYVEDSQVTMERNPDYWQTTTIDGKEYQLPFVDKLVQPIIGDVSTQVAALRTAKIDWHKGLKKENEESLANTSPGLVKYQVASGNVYLAALNVADSEYFGNKDLRRALMIGTDLRAIRDNLLKGKIHAFPLVTGGIYTPVEELPPSVAELFDYDPEKARRIISDAGYPSGFSIKLVVSSNALQQDMASMLVEMWSKIGIDTDLRMVEEAVIYQLRESHQYDDVLLTSTGNTIPFAHLSVGQGGQGYNFAGFDDPYFNAQFEEFSQALNPEEQRTIGKDLCLYLLDESPYVPLGDMNIVLYHWPWIQNYYGELDCGFMNFSPYVSRLWIDQAMKKNMGF